MIIRYEVGVHGSKEGAWDAYEEAMLDVGYDDEDIEAVGEEALVAYVGYEVILHVAFDTETRKWWIEKIDAENNTFYLPR